MRLVLKLKVLNNCEYDLKYNHKCQGFIYNLIRNTPYERLHNERDYKFFNFSNFIPPTDFKEGEIKTLIISSPDNNFIKTLLERINEIKQPLKIGEMMFKIKDYQIIKPKIQNACTLITGTPIIIRIPKTKYEKYGISAKYNYIYWRSKLPFEAFINQIEENIIKKYEKFYKFEENQIVIIRKKVLPLLQENILKKEVCNHVIIGGKEVKVFGSLWIFNFIELKNIQKKILKFNLETGFGERNSMGFGFMNLINKNPKK